MKSCKLKFSKYCVLGKQTKVTFKVTEKKNRTKRILDYIHSDVWEVHRQNLIMVLAIMSYSWMIIHGRFEPTSCGRNLKSLQGSNNERPKERTKRGGRSSTCTVTIEVNIEMKSP